MFQISEGVIGTYIAQKDRDTVNYLQRVVAKMKEENPHLFDSILNSAKTCARNMTKLRRDKEVDAEAFRRGIEMNILLYCMSVYHCIDMQLEVNDLEKTYGESET